MNNSLPVSLVPGLGPVPLQFGPQRDHLAPGASQPHRPLSRTRSEPLPHSQQGALHSHLLQQHGSQLLDRLKQHNLLGKVAQRRPLLDTARHCTHYSQALHSLQPGTAHTTARHCTHYSQALHTLQPGSACTTARECTQYNQALHTQCTTRH